MTSEWIGALKMWWLPLVCLALSLAFDLRASWLRKKVMQLTLKPPSGEAAASLESATNFYSLRKRLQSGEWIAGIILTVTGLVRRFEDAVFAPYALAALFLIATAVSVLEIGRSRGALEWSTSPQDSYV
jgi:hypothetical protein